MSERESHFQDFAKLLFAELDARGYLWLGEEEDQSCCDLLAQRAYDLVKHATDFLDVWEAHQALDHSYNWDALFEQIPDLTAWPQSEV